MPQQPARDFGARVFLDESKMKDYLLAAAVVEPLDFERFRKAIRELLLPGQRRIHMKTEKVQRKRQILDAVVRLQPAIVIFRADRSLRTEMRRRDACLRAAAARASSRGYAELVFEIDMNTIERDRRVLYRALPRETVRYRHETAATEPLLSIPDVVGWAYAKGGQWRSTAQQLEISLEDS